MSEDRANTSNDYDDDYDYSDYSDEDTCAKTVDYPISSNKRKYSTYKSDGSCQVFLSKT